MTTSNRKEAVEFVVQKLKERFPKLMIEPIEMKNGEYKIEVLQRKIYTNKGIRRSVSLKRIEASILEFYVDWSMNQRSSGDKQ